MMTQTTEVSHSDTHTHTRTNKVYVPYFQTVIFSTFSIKRQQHKWRIGKRQMFISSFLPDKQLLYFQNVCFYFIYLYIIVFLLFGHCLQREGWNNNLNAKH